MDKKKRDEFLAHYGVMGMKWGRHTSGSSKSSSKTAKSTLKSKRAKINKDYQSDLKKIHDNAKKSGLSKKEVNARELKGVVARSDKYTSDLKKAKSEYNKSKKASKTKKPKLQKKRMSEMSNEELKNFNTRMNLEKQYRKLSKSKVDVGRRVFNNIVLNSAQVVATAYVVNRFKRVVH